MMNNGKEATNIRLSREELLLTLSLLETDFIPGLDNDPLGELNRDQYTLALTWAERALRARGLAQRFDGELKVHSTLLTAVGVCAYSQNALFVYHWPSGQETPLRYFGHLRGDQVVAHTRPEDVLHQFALLSSKAHLIDQALAACRYVETPVSPLAEFELSREPLSRARELANLGQSQTAAEQLIAAGAPTESAKALATTLAAAPRVSILQTLKQQADGSVLKRDFTLLQTRDQTWLIIAPPPANDRTTLLVKPAGKDEIEALLTAGL